MSKSKEEILDENSYDVHFYGGGRNCVLGAMDEYAEQEAIEFYIWILKNIGEYLNELKLYSNLTEKKKMEIEAFETSTVPQRYELYLQSKSKSKNK